MTKEDNYKEFIFAKEIKVGKNVHFAKGVRIAAINGEADYVEIGDNVFLGENVLILTPKFIIGDYSTIHKNCRISGYKPCTIGHNFWVDQNCILNYTELLQIGNNVGIGAYSQLWTHIKFGDVLAGCRFNSSKQMIIEDDVWFVGHCIVSPVVAKRRSMAMVGSVITKDMDENHIYGGSPAINLSPKIGFQFEETANEKKIHIFEELIASFLNIRKDFLKEQIVFSLEVKIPDKINPNAVYFFLNSRTYIKQRSEIEIAFMKFILPTAKFIPKQ